MPRQTRFLEPMNYNFFLRCLSLTKRNIGFGFFLSLLTAPYPVIAGNCWSILNTSTQNVTQISSADVIDLSWNNGNMSRCSEPFWKDGFQYLNCGGKLTNTGASAFYDQTEKEWRTKWIKEEKKCTCDKVSSNDYRQICLTTLSGYVDGLNIPIKKIATETRVFRSIKPEF